jgi:putative spermidine/putrescine transport system permease protein
MAGSLGARCWNAVVVVVMAFFLLNVAMMVPAVATNSVASAGSAPCCPTASPQLVRGRLEGVPAVAGAAGHRGGGGRGGVLSIVLGVPAAYALARRDFRGKRLLMTLFLLPMLVPPITYGIPLATVFYQLHLAGTLWGVILANLLPALPFVILVMTPFIEQIDVNLESAARVFGARTFQVFWHVLVPLLVPGILAASLLVLVRTVAMFELTFLTAGADSQTLVVALYYAVFAAGVRAPQSVDAMAIVYMGVTLVWLLVAMRFVSPTQLVSRVKNIHRRHKCRSTPTAAWSAWVKPSAARRPCRHRSTNSPRPTCWARTRWPSRRTTTTCCTATSALPAAVWRRVRHRLLTSRCGTCWARPRTSRCTSCWAVPCATPCRSTTPAPATPTTRPASAAW